MMVFGGTGNWQNEAQADLIRESEKERELEKERDGAEKEQESEADGIHAGRS